MTYFLNRFTKKKTRSWQIIATNSDERNKAEPHPLPLHLYHLRTNQPPSQRIVIYNPFRNANSPQKNRGDSVTFWSQNDVFSFFGMMSNPTFPRKHTTTEPIRVKIGTIVYFDVKKSQIKLQIFWRSDGVIIFSRWIYYQCENYPGVMHIVRILHKSKKNTPLLPCTKNNNRSKQIKQ